MPAEATVHLVRHAHALDRHAWEAPDAERPLSAKGARQADALAERLAGRDLARLVTSPARRCRQTMEPLAARLGLALEERPWLAEGEPSGAALERLVEALEPLGGANLVACTHGDVLDGLLDAVRRAGAELDGPAHGEKAATYELLVRRGSVARVVHVPAPRVVGVR